MKNRKHLYVAAIITTIIALILITILVVRHNTKLSVRSEFNAIEVRNSCKNGVMKLLDNPISTKFIQDDSFEEIAINQEFEEATWYSSVSVIFDMNRNIKVDFKCVYNYGSGALTLKLRLF